MSLLYNSCPESFNFSFSGRLLQTVQRLPDSFHRQNILRILISTGNAVQKSVNQFLDQKVIGLRVINVAHALGLGRDKAGLAVKINIAGDGKRPAPISPAFSME